MSSRTMQITLRVDCYSGYRGEETPRQFWMAARCVRVREVLDQWLAPDHRYFKLLGDDDDIYILRHNPYDQVWELTFFSAASRGSDEGGFEPLDRAQKTEL